MTKEDSSGEEQARYSAPKRRDLFLNEYFSNTSEERQDVIFRRVRGILNKITPETFDKLSKDLVNVGLDSPRTLRGLIYLLFDKALKDLKYSSLYAKLCQKLSEKSPNFEKEPGPNTFCKFLISKCEDEFERRRKATEDFECKNELTDEEFEQKVIAKQKMLGNIKFICELGKKRLLQEEILHECIRGLLSRKKERTLQDQAQDLECLCQIMRTIGSLLDIETSRNLMNQYFERIDMYSRKPELPSRIRFMLRDVIDLRNNNWRPRPFQREDNVPQPLSKLREEAGFSNIASSAPIDKLGNTKNLMNINNLSKLNAKELSSLLIDDDEPGFTTSTDFHWGPDPFLPHENEYDIFSSNTYNQSSKAPNATTAIKPVKVTNTNPSTYDSPTVSFNPNPKFQGSLVAMTNNPIAPRFLQTSRYDSFVGSGQTQFDTFARVPNNSTARSAANDREPASANVNDNMPSKRNDHSNGRHNMARGFDKRSFARDGPVIWQPQSPLVQSPPASNAKPGEFDINSAIPKQSSRDEHFRCNNHVRNTASQHHDHDQQPHQQRFQSRNMSNHDDEPHPGPYNDSSKSLPHDRNNDNPSSYRNLSSNARIHNLSESSSHSPTGPTPSMAYHSRGAQNEQHQNQSNQRHTQMAQPPTNGNMRSRRFEHEPRQPKFSGANYRLPGRERPPPQNIGRNQQPESELNLNWRSVEAARPKPQPLAQDQVDCQQGLANPKHKMTSIPDNPNKSIAESNRQRNLLGEEEGASTNQMGRLGNPGFSDPDFNRGESSARTQNTAIGKSQLATQNNYLVPDLNPRRTPSPHQVKRTHPSEVKYHPNRDHPPPRFVNNSNVQSRSSNPNSTEANPNQISRSRRSNHDSQDFRPETSEQYNHHHSNHHEQVNMAEKNDSKKQDQRQRPFSPIQHLGGSRHDTDVKRPNQRLTDPQSGHDRKGYQPPSIGRNQSFDGHAALDFKRGPNWRNDNSGQSSNSSVKRDPLPTPASIVSAHQVVPRPQFRLSATDFSLRPSHNLGGRAVIETSSAKLADHNSEDKSASTNQTESKTTTRSLVEHSARQMFGSKDSADTSAGASGLKAPKTVAKSDTHQFMTKFMSSFKHYLSEDSPDISKFNSNLKDMKLPREIHEECLISAMKFTICKSEQDRERTSSMFNQAIPSVFETSALLISFKKLFEQMKALEVETPKAKSLVAGFLSRAVVGNLLAIEDVAQVLNGGKHHPLFLLFLQKLEKSAGQAWLSEKFIASKINLMDMLPEVDRTKDRLASALKDRCLGFLDPMLTIEPDLWAQMRDRDPSPAAVYRWIKDNVDQTIQSTPTFAHVFISCLLKYIHSTTSERSVNNNNNNSTNNNNNNQQKDSDSTDSSKSSPTNSSSQVINDQEKELLSKYQQMMHAILKDKQMQLATLYALQSFYHGLNFPKGALLRWFHMLYDLSIVDDDVFFIWKEEINDKVPGKGHALFQVNTWLNWLAEPDSEDEEDS